jgi:hypothetical protein
MWSSRRTRFLAVAIGALVTFSAEPQFATARPPDGHGTRSVTFTTRGETVGGDFGCDPTDPTRCAGTFRNVHTFAGDFVGTSYQVGSAVLLPDGIYHGQAVSTFTGTVAGCGSGTLVILETGLLDPSNGDSWGTWTIVRGEGTGELSELSGSGTADTRTSDPATGTVRCS